MPMGEGYTADKTALKGTKKLARFDSVATKLFKKGKGVLPDNDPVTPDVIKKLGDTGRVVREGEF